jgi:hypothetical protein
VRRLCARAASSRSALQSSKPPSPRECNQIDLFVLAHIVDDGDEFLHDRIVAMVPPVPPPYCRRVGREVGIGGDVFSVEFERLCDDEAELVNGDRQLGGGCPA